jgi:hypothetical protein
MFVKASFHAFLDVFSYSLSDTSIIHAASIKKKEKKCVIYFLMNISLINLGNVNPI